MATVAPVFRSMNAPTKIAQIGNRLQFAWMEQNYTQIQKTAFFVALVFVTMLDAIVIAAVGKIFLVHLLKQRDYLS